MSFVAIAGNPSGTGTLTVSAPNTNNNRALTLPDASGELSVGPRLQTARASTSGTSIDFTAIPAWVKRITLLFAGLSTNGTAKPMVQIGDAGGLELTGYLGSEGNTAGGAVGSQVLPGAGFAIRTGINAGVVLHGRVVLELLDAVTNTWIATSLSGQSDSVNISYTAGSKALSQALDRVRLTTSNGTDVFDAGLVNISYE